MAATIVRWISFVALFTLLLVHVERRGPIELRRPATVLSNGHPVQKQAEPYLLFLQAVRSAVPAGATIVVVGADILDPLHYLALGQLPEHRLLPPASLGNSDEERRDLPRFVAFYQGALEDGRYRHFIHLETGNVYEVAR